MDQNPSRNALLVLPDEQLIRLCRVDTFRGTGRGGQKRNKTESAVRVTHEGTGCSAVSDATRSQHTNRRLALRRLRHEIALKCRVLPTPPIGEWARPAATSERYPLWVASVLDALDAHGFRIRETAKFLHTTTGRLVRLLADDTQLWQVVNEARRRARLTPLREH